MNTATDAVVFLRESDAKNWLRYNVEASVRGSVAIELHKISEADLKLAIRNLVFD